MSKRQDGNANKLQERRVILSREILTLNGKIIETSRSIDRLKDLYVGYHMQPFDVLAGLHNDNFIRFEIDSDILFEALNLQLGRLNRVRQDKQDFIRAIEENQRKGNGK